MEKKLSHSGKRLLIPAMTVPGTVFVPAMTVFRWGLQTLRAGPDNYDHHRTRHVNCKQPARVLRRGAPMAKQSATQRRPSRPKSPRPTRSQAPPKVEPGPGRAKHAIARSSDKPADGNPVPSARQGPRTSFDVRRSVRHDAAGKTKQQPRRGKILVGTASWTDPGFIADWYPPKLPAGQRLPWYAEHFNLVEVNSSFYAVPGTTMTARWCDQTPAGFVFDMKLHKLLSLAHLVSDAPGSP